MLYLTLRQYEYIVGVADAGSLTKAAAQLNVSQPSLSVAISRVEARLNAEIFRRRKGAAIDITPYGHKLINDARSVLARATAIENAETAVRPFVLGCFAEIGPWYLAPALNRLGVRFPDKIFQGREGRFADIANDLSQGHMDAAISFDVGLDGSFERRTIADIAPVVFLATDHPLAHRESVDLSELMRDSLILFDEDLSEGFMRDLFKRLRLEPVIQQKVSSLEMMRSYAAHGAGVGISYSRPPGDISYDGKRLAAVPISTAEARTQISLIWSSLRPSSTEFDAVLDTLAP